MLRRRYKRKDSANRPKRNCPVKNSSWISIISAFNSFRSSTKTLKKWPTCSLIIFPQRFKEPINRNTLISNRPSYILHNTFHQMLSVIPSVRKNSSRQIIYLLNWLTSISIHKVWRSMAMNSNSYSKRFPRWLRKTSKKRDSESSIWTI